MNPTASSSLSPAQSSEKSPREASWGLKPRITVSATLGLGLALTLAGCGEIGAQSAADDLAASYADHDLPVVLNEAANSAQDGQQLSAVKQELTSPTNSFLVRRRDASWVVSQASDTQFLVVLWVYWEDKSFSAAQKWGIACREYTVAESVTVHPAECPDDTPQTPGPGAISWYYRSQVN